MDLGRHYLEIALKTFQKQKMLAEKALTQLSPEEYLILIESRSKLHCHHHETHGWKYALTLDGFFNY